MASVYLPLDDGSRLLRLLELAPGRSDEDIQCQLHTASLDEKPKYRALSYVWGDPNDTRQIYLNSRAFNVTKNLYAALWRLRAESRSITMWADAICINQSDLDERSAQVAMMSDIYKCTEEVVIWLGEPELEEATNDPNILFTGSRVTESSSGRPAGILSDEINAIAGNFASLAPDRGSGEASTSDVHEPPTALDGRAMDGNEAPSEREGIDPEMLTIYALLSLDVQEDEKRWLEDVCRQARALVFGRKPMAQLSPPPSGRAFSMYKANMRLMELGMQSQRRDLDSKRDPALIGNIFPFSTDIDASLRALKDFFAQEAMHPEWPIIGACIILFLLAIDSHFHAMPFFEKVEEGADLAFYGSSLWLESAQALEKMLTQKYWSRVWILQEIVLARRANVHYGRHIIPFPVLVLAQRNLERHYHSCCSKWGAGAHAALHSWWYGFVKGFEPIGQITDLSALRATNAEHLSLSDVLHCVFGSRTTTDARDYVYGILGLVSESKDKGIVPNYKLNVAGVFARAGFEIMSQESSLDLLRFNDIGHDEKHLLPSWSPDWSCPATFNPQPYPRRLFAASKKEPIFIKLGDDLCLKVRTIKADVVRQTGPVRTWKWYGPEMLVNVLDQWREIAGLVSEEEFWRTVFADSIQNSERRDGSRRLEAEDVGRIQEWWHWLQEQAKAPVVREWHMLTTRFATPSLMSTFADRTESRKFFITEAGRPGTGVDTIKSSEANSVQPGDEIHVVMGSDVPFVLRPMRGGKYSFTADSERQGDGSGSLSKTPEKKNLDITNYTLVGTCFVLGIMDGEVLDDPENKAQIVSLN